MRLKLFKFIVDTPLNFILMYLTYNESNDIKRLDSTAQNMIPYYESSLLGIRFAIFSRIITKWIITKEGIEKEVPSVMTYVLLWNKFTEQYYVYTSDNIELKSKVRKI